MEQTVLDLLLSDQRSYFKTGATISVASRKKALTALKKAIKAREDEILQALNADLGKHQSEAYMAEIGMVYSEIDYMLKNVTSLAAPRKVSTPLFLFPSRSRIFPIPYGTVLIMSPWNYPFLLTMQPLVDALAAGNTAIVKPSAYSANTSKIIEAIIMETFEPDYVSVVLGGRQENQALLDLDFDYIFFTGSVEVGKTVMAKASTHLTPVTLELGGKSPCIVDETANIALAARRIVFGKFLNAGQTCVCPDYVYVHESVHDALVQQIRHQIALQYPSMDSIGKIINEKHFKRLIGLIDPSHCVCGGTSSAALNQIAPTVLDHVTWDMPVMQEEIFGPILPILTYTDFDETLQTIRSHPTPLASYLFSSNAGHILVFEKIQPFGSGCINDCIVQLSNHNLPFGGMGESGIGKYHGKFGFNTFSHLKSILISSSCVDLPFRYAPYPEWAGKLMKFMLG